MHGIVPGVWELCRNCAGAKRGIKNVPEIVPEVLGCAGNCAELCTELCRNIWGPWGIVPVAKHGLIIVHGIVHENCAGTSKLCRQLKPRTAAYHLPEVSLGWQAAGGTNTPV